jgi:hypothetical protein
MMTLHFLLKTDCSCRYSSIYGFNLGRVIFANVYFKLPIVANNHNHQ